MAYFNCVTRAFFLTAAFIFSGCHYFTAYSDEGSDADSVLVVNESDLRLIVSAMNEDLLAAALIASELQVAADNPGILFPGGTQTIAWDDIAGDFDTSSTAVFHVYSAPLSEADTSLFRLSASIHLSYDELKERSFRMVIRPEDLTYAHPFGDPDWILSDETAHRDSDPARGADPYADAFVLTS